MTNSTEIMKTWSPLRYFLTQWLNVHGCSHFPKLSSLNTIHFSMYFILLEQMIVSLGHIFVFVMFAASYLYFSTIASINNSCVVDWAKASLSDEVESKIFLLLRLILSVIDEQKKCLRRESHLKAHRKAAELLREILKPC